MAGRPRRERPKVPVQLRVEAGAGGRVAQLLRGGGGPGSLSALVEALLFLLEAIYVEEDEGAFVRRGYELRARQLMRAARSGQEPRMGLVHLTLDAGALGFADLLARRHPGLWRTRGELVDALLFAAGECCGDADLERYLARRLRDAQLLHPQRPRRA